MATGSRGRRWFLTLTCLYGAILAALTLLNRSGADRFWVGAFNLYLPQIIWTAPGIFLTFFSLKAAPRWIWAPLLCLVWVLGPIMGFSWNGNTAEGTAGGRSLRVMSWNVKYGGSNRVTQLAISYAIEETGADVVLLQDAGGLLSGPMGDLFRGWNVRSIGQYIIASKLPLDEAEERPIPFPGENAVCMRSRLRVGNKSVILYDVHFESPRSGLNAFRDVRRKPWYLPGAIQRLGDNVDDRLWQSQALRKMVEREREPVIVAGDLNSPEASRASQTLREAGLRDAFSEGGRGYGYTYGHQLLRHRLPWLSASWMRIDHIMLSDRFRALSCRAGTKDLSEHRPVIADIVLVPGT